MRKLLAESVKRQIVDWQKSPAFDTFCELKHGPFGAVLAALQEGEISKGKAAECLAEIAHGATEVNLPPAESIFGWDEMPTEAVKAKDAEIARLREELADLKAEGTKA